MSDEFDFKGAAKRSSELMVEIAKASAAARDAVAAYHQAEAELREAEGVLETLRWEFAALSRSVMDASKR